MKLTTKQKEQKRAEAIKELKLFIKPTSTLIIVIKSVSRSGMARKMKVFTVDKKTGRLLHHTYYIADLLGYTYNQDDTITISGCGMDMAFWLADTITHYMYPKKSQRKNMIGNGGTCLNWQTIN